MALAGMAAALAISLGGMPAAQAATDIYEVRNVTVDVTAETAADAQAKALAQAERQSFDILLRRLTLSEDHDRLPEPGAEEIADAVATFDIAEQKLSSVRFIGTLNYRFREDAVRDLLQRHAIAFAETPSKPVVILPVYGAAGALLLWDEPNPWRNAWQRMAPPRGLVPLVVPLGDLGDIAAIGAEQAVRGDVRALEMVASRYGAADTVVAQATLRRDPVTGLHTLETALTRHGRLTGAQTDILSFASRDGEPVDALLARAAREVALSIEDRWKRDNLLDFGQRSVLPVVVPVSSLKQWLGIRDRLNDLPMVARVDVVRLSRNQAQLHLHVLGRAEQVRLALAQVDLVLEEPAIGGGPWILRPADTAAGANPPGTPGVYRPSDADMDAGTGAQAR